VPRRLAGPLALALALLPACRGCSRDPAGGPAPGVVGSAPTTPAASLPGPEILAALGGGLQGETTVEQLVARLPEGSRHQAREALEHYVYCAAAADVAACSRLEGDHRHWCREVTAQIRARAAGERPWFGVPEAMTICGEHAPPADCRRYASAVEEGNPAGCEGLPRGMEDCAAVAAGDPTRCDALGREAASCRQTARSLAALRRGVAELAATPDGAWRAAAIGRLSGRSACEAEIRRELGAR
jgi:hypothetical protein